MAGDVIKEFLFGFGLQDNVSEPLADLEGRSEETAGKMQSGWATAGKAIGASIAAIGVAGVAAAAGLFELVDRSTANADAIAKAARNAGIASGEFQKLAHAANLSDVSVETLTRSAQDLERQILEARDGGAKPFVESLGSIGLEIDDLSGTATDKLGTIFDALNSVKDEGTRTALAVELLGRGGRTMGSLIAGGSEELRNMGDEAQRLGLVIDEAALAASEEFQDSLTRMQGSVASLARDVGIALAPTVQDVTDDITEWTAANRDYLTSEISDTVGDLTDALIDLAPSIETINGLMGFLSDAATAGAVAIRTVKLEAEALAEGDFARAAGFEPLEQAASEIATERQQKASQRAERREQRALERAAEGSLQAQRETLAAARQLPGVRGTDRRPPSKGGGKRRDRALDFEAEDFELLAAEEALGADIDALARQADATPEQRQEALEAASSSLASNASPNVAKQAAASRLSSLTGRDIKARDEDPLLSQIFGEDVPDIELSSLAVGAQPQTLVVNITNHFDFDIDQAISGAGDPTELADANIRSLREIFVQALESTTKTAKVNFAR